MKYYVVTDLGYDGVIVDEFTSEQEARNLYENRKSQVSFDDTGQVAEDSYSNGIELLRGEVIERTGEAIWRENK